MIKPAGSCHKIGCLAHAHWRLHFKCKALARDGTLWPFDMQSSIMVCDDHRRAAAEAMLHERQLDAIADRLEQDNFMPPFPGSIHVEFSRVM